MHQLLVQSAGGQEAVEVLAIDADVELLPSHVSPGGGTSVRKSHEKMGQEGDTEVWSDETRVHKLESQPRCALVPRIAGSHASARGEGAKTSAQAHTNTETKRSHTLPSWGTLE